MVIRIRFYFGRRYEVNFFCGFVEDFIWVGVCYGERLYS